jgi:hypothetical protein
MEGQIPENKLSKFRPQVKEEGVYYMKHFQVLPARRVYRQVDSPYLARFTAFMKIYNIDVVPPSFPLYAHAAVPFDVLRSRVGIREFTSGTGCSRLLPPIPPLCLASGINLIRFRLVTTWIDNKIALFPSSLYRRIWGPHGVYRRQSATEAVRWGEASPERFYYKREVSIRSE